MDYYVVGDRIREYRERRNLSQDELAELASIHRVTLSRYESGRVEPGAQALARIADALGVTVDMLLGREDEKGKDQNQPPRTMQARIISGGVDQLPMEERNRILSVLQAMYSNYPDLFDYKKGDDDET